MYEFTKRLKNPFLSLDIKKLSIHHVSIDGFSLHQGFSKSRLYDFTISLKNQSLSLDIKKLSIHGVSIDGFLLHQGFSKSRLYDFTISLKKSSLSLKIKNCLYIASQLMDFCSIKASLNSDCMILLKALKSHPFP